MQSIALACVIILSIYFHTYNGKKILPKNINLDFSNDLNLPYKSSLMVRISTLLLLSAPTTIIAENESKISKFSSVEETANFIERNCKEILKSVKSSGKLLYRGETINSTELTSYLLDIKSDLFDINTYKNPIIADYFKVIDKSMSQYQVENNISNVILPSNSHIGTSNEMIASEWGPLYSVWPLDNISYAFSKSYTYNLWNDEWLLPQQNNKNNKLGFYFWNNQNKLNQFIKDLSFNRNLDLALSQGKEIFFHSSMNKYVAVPIALVPKLIKLLNIIEYSETLKVSKVSSMIVEGNIKKSIRLPSSIR